MATENQFHAVVLAAQRVGVVNELAKDAGVSHKCIMPLAGKMLIDHTLSGIAAAPEIGFITVVIDSIDVGRESELVRKLEDEGKLRLIEGGANLFDSVSLALTGEPEKKLFPSIITTADNVLLTADMIAYFCAEVIKSGADAAAAMVTKEMMQSKYPEGQKKFHRFKDGEYSNCNTYSIVTEAAVQVAEAFKTGGQFAKSPKRVLKAFGLVNAIAYRYAWFSRDKAFDRIGKRAGIKLKAIDLPFPEAPIDVDNFRTKRIAGEILEARQTEQAGQSK